MHPVAHHCAILYSYTPLFYFRPPIRLSKAQSVYRESDLNRLREIFVRVAHEAVDGLPYENEPLENLQVGSSAIIGKLLHLRQSNLGAKEVSLRLKINVGTHAQMLHLT